MITQYRVQNFKNLVDIGENFTPQPLNVIIGPNGGGKTSLLQSIDFLRAFFMSSLELYLQEKDWNLRDLVNIHQPDDKQVRSQRILQWNLTASLQPNAHGHGGGTYNYFIYLAVRSRPLILIEELRFKGAGTDETFLLVRDIAGVRILNRETSEFGFVQAFTPLASVIGSLDATRDRAKYPEMIRFREWVEQFRLFGIWDPKILRSTNRGKHEELGPNGEHLASLLASLKQKRPDDFDKLLRRIKRIFPHINDLSLTGGRGWGWREIRQQEEHNGRKANLASQHMSDGVLRLLAVSSLLYLDHVPSVVMFEEPENGVHPQLLREVVAILRELTLQKPPRQCQVFFTTHSPYILDEFYDHPEEVFVMGRGATNAGASIMQLSTSEQLSSVREGFQSLGEAWFSSLIGGTARGE